MNPEDLQNLLQEEATNILKHLEASDHILVTSFRNARMLLAEDLLVTLGRVTKKIKDGEAQR